jgi:transcriptional regulator GlxA family with amidase domain
MDDASWDLRTLVDAFAAEDRSPRARVRRLVEWILENPARPCSVERLAERAALSPRSLSRLFRRETGMAPAKFVEQARLALARRLLERVARVRWVAIHSGFRSEERMRRAFQRSLGMSPRRYASSGCGTMRR